MEDMAARGGHGYAAGAAARGAVGAAGPLSVTATRNLPRQSARLTDRRRGAGHRPAGERGSLKRARDGGGLGPRHRLSECTSLYRIGRVPGRAGRCGARATTAVRTPATLAQSGGSSRGGAWRQDASSVAWRRKLRSRAQKLIPSTGTSSRSRRRAAATTISTSPCRPDRRVAPPQPPRRRAATGSAHCSRRWRAGPA